MNEKLIRKSKIDTPKIDFNINGKLSIEGKSFPPDVTVFYSDVLNWLDEYIENPADKTVLVLKLDYFNTASSKIIMDILYRMEKLHSNNHDVLVDWFYPDDDEDMMETGKEYQELINVPFKQNGYKFIIE